MILMRWTINFIRTPVLQKEQYTTRLSRVYSKQMGHRAARIGPKISQELVGSMGRVLPTGDRIKKMTSDDTSNSGIAGLSHQENMCSSDVQPR